MSSFYISCAYHKTVSKSKSKSKSEKFIGLYEKHMGANNLVVGCGAGSELTNLASFFPSSNFVGIDIKIVNSESKANWQKISMDVENLTFAPESFDFVYCHHVLEHVSNPQTALKQIRLVLKPLGYVFIGTPNKQRILGYFSSEATFIEKLKWNYNDLSSKFRLKFENRYGAHAGFTSKEMKTMLGDNFVEIIDVSHQYYLDLYPNYHLILKVLRFLKLTNFIFPSIYFTCRAPGKT